MKKEGKKDNPHNHTDVVIAAGDSNTGQVFTCDLWILLKNSNESHQRTSKERQWMKKEYWKKVDEKERKEEGIRVIKEKERRKEIIISIIGI